MKIIIVCRTVSRLDSSLTDTSPRIDPWLTSPRRTIPRRPLPRPDNSPTGHFPDRTLSRRRLPRRDISPLRRFPSRIFRRPYRIFIFLHFLRKPFVKANGLDFQLDFSWFIILSINFIYTKFIYKRFNLLNIACQCSAIIFS